MERLFQESVWLVFLLGALFGASMMFLIILHQLLKLRKQMQKGGDVAPLKYRLTPRKP